MGGFGEARSMHQRVAREGEFLGEGQRALSQGERCKLLQWGLERSTCGQTVFLQPGWTFRTARLRTTHKTYKVILFMFLCNQCFSIHYL